MARPKGGTNQCRSCNEKAELIEKYYDSGMGYKKFAKDHGISPSLFYEWLKKYQEGGIDGLRRSSQINPHSKNQRDEEILRLKLLIAEQQVEIQKLKELIK